MQTVKLLYTINSQLRLKIINTDSEILNKKENVLL